MTTTTRETTAWRPVSDPPPCTPVWYGELQSALVLCWYRSGRVGVAYLQQDSDDQSSQWITADSNGWDVTGKITHWMPLPDPPVTTT